MVSISRIKKVSIEVWQFQSDREKSRRPGGAAYVLLAISIPFFTKKKDERNNPEALMKSATTHIIMGELKEADVDLHDILDILLEQRSSQQITEREYLSKRARIYCEMANLSLLTEQLDNAKTLLTETIRDCLTVGIQRTDAMIVEISLKLALVYAKLGENDNADSGFKFCIATQTQKLADGIPDYDERQNHEALLGMASNYYSKFLYERGRLTEALRHAERSLDVATRLYTDLHPNYVNLLNDIALIQSGLGQQETALASLNRAVAVCEAHPDPALVILLPTFYCNMAVLLGGEEKWAEASDWLDKAKKLLAEGEFGSAKPYLQNKLESVRVMLSQWQTGIEPDDVIREKNDGN